MPMQRKGGPPQTGSAMEELRAEIRKARADMTALKASDVDLRGAVFRLEQRLAKVEAVQGLLAKGEEPVPEEPQPGELTPQETPE